MQIDIHSHIIPGVDDGSQDLETSLGLLRMAAENGTTDIIATPHVIDVSTTLTWDIIRRKVEELQKEADSHGIPITIYPGAETELNWDLLELMRKERSAFCLAGSRYCLMEMPSLMLPPHLDEIIYESRIPEETVAALQAMGHRTRAYPDWDRVMGAVNSVAILPDGTLAGAADPRRDGLAVGI